MLERGSFEDPRHSCGALSEQKHSQSDGDVKQRLLELVFVTVVRVLVCFFPPPV